MVQNARILFFLAMTQVLVVVVVVLLVARGADARQPLYRHVFPIMGRRGTRRSSITSRRYYYPHILHPPNDDLTAAGNLLSSTSSTIDAVIRTRTKTTRGRTATADTTSSSTGSGTASQQQGESSASAKAAAAAAAGGDTQHLLAAEQSPSSTSDPENDTADDDSSSASSRIIKKSFLSHISDTITTTTTIATAFLPKSLLLVSHWALGIGAVGAIAWGLHHWLVVTKMDGWINKIDNNNNKKNSSAEFFQLRSVPLDDWILMCRWEMPVFWNQNFASHFDNDDTNDGGDNSNFNQKKLKMAVRPYMKERLRKARKVTSILDQKEEEQEQKKRGGGGGGDGECWTEEEATTVAEFYASVTAERLVGVVEALERRLLLVEPQPAKSNRKTRTGENDSTARRPRRRKVSRKQLVARLAGRIRQGILLMTGNGGDLDLALLFSESTLREFFKDSLRESIYYYSSSSTEEEEEVVTRRSEDDEDDDDGSIPEDDAANVDSLVE